MSNPAQEPISCKNCSSTNLNIEQVEGRGLPPKDEPKTNKRISWKGMWNVYTCNNCGNSWRKLIK